MMSLMKKELKDAEDELLIQSKVDECIEMYQNLYKYDEAIRVAEAARHPDTTDMRQVLLPPAVNLTKKLISHIWLLFVL